MSRDEQARLRAARGRRGRHRSLPGRPTADRAGPELDERTVGLPLDELREQADPVGVAAGPGRGPIALAAIRAGCVNVLATDDATADWVLAHG